ncbi:MAG: hypothetical protein Kow0025_25010 [Thermodesulfovibrionales bacterium]
MKATGRPAVVEHVHLDGAGRPRHYELHCYPVLDASGKVVQVIEHSIDITERRKAAEEIARYAGNLEKLLVVSRDITATSDLEELYRRIITISRDLLGLDFSTIMVVSEDRSSLVIRDTIGFPETMKDTFCLMEGHGLSTHVAKTRTPGVVPDFQEETRFEVPPVVFEKGISSAICVPMIFEDEVLGVLIGHTLRRRDFTDEEISLYQSIANQGALAISSSLTLDLLLESEERYRDLFENANDLIQCVNPDGTFLYVNRAWRETLGYTEEEVAGLSVFDIIDEGCLGHCMATLKRALSGERVDKVEAVFKKKDGTRLVAEGSVNSRMEGGRPVSTRCILRDVTERKKAEERIRFLASIVQNIPDAVCSTDLEGNILSWNSGAERMLGYRAGEVLGTHITRVMPAETAQSEFEHCTSVLMEEGFFAGHESTRVALDGRRVPVEITAVALRGSDDRVIGFASIMRDITERKQAEKELERRAFYDKLTNLPNRSLFMDRLNTAINHSRRRRDYLFAVLFMDLDRFKVVNDSLGHIIGDQLLVEVARRLEACLRPTDTVARLGGDEFAILIQDIRDASDATRVAERIQKKLSVPFKLDGHEVFTSASIGIALSSTGYEREDYLLRDADAAMYRAKAHGRARYEMFDVEMHARAVETLELESDLRKAVEQGEFLLHYQPIVSARTGRITGAEALIRWRHPRRGLIPPLAFIPLAEETGLIHSIGQWVLRTACAQRRAWSDEGFDDILMEVNFSPRQFQQNSLPALMRDVLGETGLEASSLEMGITESTVMERFSIPVLEEISSIGVGVSIDDFGTGYSSLVSLRSFPVNTIKIDKAFVKDIITDPNPKAITRAIIAMAHSLNMEVVAEGVETAEQMEFLRAEGCDKIQGYIISPPVPAEEFTELLREDRQGGGSP